ncbi:MAG TPA: hypothetical protein DCG75_05545 [Bacteroidales bacterium]|nr:hypothetical protein [Bacteroidales bacterium]
MRYVLKSLFCTLLFYYIGVIAVAQNIEGYVFVDNNKNSIMDSDEKGIKGVMVSNQKDVVITDEKGHFKIKLKEEKFIFVTKPEAYQFKLDKYNNPEFYFLFKTKKTKEQLKYRSSEPITEIPEFLYFPVYNNPGEEEHSCLLIGDPQMKDDEKLVFYKDGIIPYMATKQVDFYVVLGDISHNNPEILPKEKQISATLGVPGYRVFGNHDINYKAADNKHAAETFKMVYGPDYYSFDFGSFHYIILNNVLYDGWWKEINAPGRYSGGLSEEQKKWLINDLMLVSSNKTIVLFSHIPFDKIFVKENSMQTLFKALENHKKILAVSGHLHYIVAYDYTADDGWEYNANFEGLVAGAACGAWWSGLLDENNIPFSTCPDGSPKGFFQLNVTKDDYNYVFHPVNYPNDFQFRTYINKDEICVNWFVGKKTDSVWVYLDNNPIAIKLHNFIGTDSFVESIYKAHKDMQKTTLVKTAHLWKAKLPENISTGYHSVKVFARDSKGILFKGFKTFYIEK